MSSIRTNACSSVIGRRISAIVGIEAFTTLTAEYGVVSEIDAMGSVTSGLSYYDKIQDGSIELWVYDENGDVTTVDSRAVIVNATV